MIVLPAVFTPNFSKRLDKIHRSVLWVAQLVLKGQSLTFQGLSL